MNNSINHVTPVKIMKKQSALSPADRGDAARQKLVEAALLIFGQHGYEGASTRQLAAEAGVNIAAIPYYFGGKEGLYLATIDSISETFRATFGDTIEMIREELKRPNLTQAECRKLLTTLVSEMIRFIVSSRKNSLHIARTIIREQLDPTPAFQRLYDGMLVHMHSTLAQLVAKLTGTSPDDPETRIRAQTIFGQIVTFKSSRETVLRNMKWKAFGDKEIEAVTSVIEFNIDAIINACQKKKS